MLLIVIRSLYLLVCAGTIATYVANLGKDASYSITHNPFLDFIILLAITQLVTLVDWLLPRKRVEIISALYFGLLIGFLLSYLLIQALEPVLMDTPIRGLLVMMITLFVPYLCVSMLLQTKDDFRFVIPYVEFQRELKGGRPLILDSSALIDGRIADLVETRVIDSRLVVPQFILQEVQEIADSSDKTRRTRGRRGLEILSKLQNNPHADIRVHEAGRSEFNGMSVDHCLVALAKQLNGRVVTNDFNLNRVASVQGIDVINLNDVANALKPRYIPGEQIRLKILKEGEAPGQGVGYLDDGTMVVCENAAPHIGQELEVIVTSMLQSSAGRMIFGKPAGHMSRQTARG